MAARGEEREVGDETHRDGRPAAAVLGRVAVAHARAPPDVEQVGRRIERADPALTCASKLVLSQLLLLERQVKEDDVDAP